MRRPGPGLHSSPFMLKHCILALCLLSLVACTSLQPVASPATSAGASLKAGDHVDVVTRAGREYKLTLTAVTPADFTGTDGDGNAWKVPLAAIDTLRVERTSALRTTGLVVDILAVVYLAAIAVTAHALGQAFDHGGD